MQSNAAQHYNALVFYFAAVYVVSSVPFRLGIYRKALIANQIVHKRKEFPLINKIAIFFL